MMSPRDPLSGAGEGIPESEQQNSLPDLAVDEDNAVDVTDDDDSLEEDLTRVSRSSAFAIIPAGMGILDLLSESGTLTGALIWFAVAVVVWYVFRLLPAYVRRHGRDEALARIRRWARLVFWAAIIGVVFFVWQWGPTIIANNAPTVRQGIGLFVLLGLLFLAHSNYRGPE